MIVASILAFVLMSAPPVADKVWPSETPLPDMTQRVELTAGDDAQWLFQGAGWVVEGLRWKKPLASVAELAHLVLPLGTFAQEAPFTDRHTTITQTADYSRLDRSLDVGKVLVTVRIMVLRDPDEARDDATPDPEHAALWRWGTASGKQRRIGEQNWTTITNTKNTVEMSFTQGRMSANVEVRVRKAGPDPELLEAVAKAIEFRAVRIPDVGLSGVPAPERRRLADEFVSLKDLGVKGATTKSYVKDGSKFADVTMKGRTYTFEQLSWYVQTPDGKVELQSPAIPYDGDLYVPSAFFKPLL